MPADDDMAGDRSDSAIFPSSYTQLRIWFAQQLDPDGTHWNVAMRWRLEGRFREAMVERAWQILVDRHEALRTGIEEVDGLPQQRVWSKVRLKFGNIDLSRLPRSQRVTAAEEIAEKEARTPIVLRPEGQHFRVQLVRLDEHTAYLLTTFHHIIVDGWSVGVLMREFGEIVSQLARGDRAELPDLPLQHVDYALWQADTLECGGFDADRAYWKRTLADVRRFEIPTDKSRSAVWSHECDIRTLLLPRDLSERLNTFAGRHAVTPFHIATATLSAVLSRVASVDDVVLGTQVACRTQPELASLVGPLINSVVLRLDASSDPSLTDLLQQSRARSLEAIEHQQLPFNFVVQDLQQRRDASRPPVLSISITTQTAHIDTGAHQDLEFGDLRIVALPSFPVGAMMDLEFVMVGREEGWRLSCIANTSLFEIATVDRLLTKWAHAIDVLVRGDAGARISTLEKLPGRRYSPSGVGTSGADQESQSGQLAGPNAAVSTASDETRLSEKVAAVWKEVLGLNQVDPDTDFFDAGGNSLSAMRMIARLNKASGLKASVRGLFSNPTLGDFVASISAESRRPDVPAGRARRPRSKIIALNNGSAYAPLARRMEGVAEIVDVECGDADDVEFARIKTFDDVVARIARRIRQRQPEGPYVLAGYCGLGQLAFEIGAFMKRRGDDVRLIIMLDARHPTYKKQFTLLASAWHSCLRAIEVVRDSRSLMRMRWRNEISTAIWLEHYGVFRAIKLTSVLSRWGLIEPLPPREASVVGFDFFDALVAKGSSASFEAQDLAVALYRSRDATKTWVFPEASGWRPYVTGRLEVCDLPCRHGEMTRDAAAAIVAPHLRDLLERLSRESEAAGSG